MKHRTLAEIAGGVVVLLPGAVGAWIVARTLMTYWGRDSLASLIVLSIGVALLVGLAEVFARQVRAGLMEQELRSLPTRPSEATIDGASAPVSALLRARLEQAPLPVLGESVAPFLTGLLVMLGLLGTLLGLFQTVHGAGHALTTSADVETLRRSLSVPIDGLTRSFGCSAAGISASAMLGLAIALVRRREARTMRVFYNYAAGPLRSLSPVRRQALALEQLAGQGLGLPSATTAIDALGTKLDVLSNHLISMQQAAASTQQRALSDLLASVRGELSRIAAEAGEALHGRVAPLMEQMAARSAEALTAQATTLSESALELTRELERDAATRRQEAVEAMQAVRARFDEAESQRSTAHARELETVMTLAARTSNDATEHQRELSERWQELVTRLDAHGEASRERDHAQLRSAEQAADLARERETEQLTRLETLTTRVGSELARLSATFSAQLEQRQASDERQDTRAERALTQLESAARAVEESATRHDSVLGQLVERLPTRFEEAAAHSREAAQTALAELAAITEQRLERVTSLLSDELTQRGESARSFDERAVQTLARVEQSAAVLDTAIERQGQGLEGLIARVGTLLPELAEAAQRGASATIERLQESVEQQAARYSEFETALRTGREEHVRGLADQLTQHAVDLEQRLAKTGEAVQEAAAIWQASSAEMQTVAELFTNSVERQREAADTWLESLGEIEGAVERAGRSAARDGLSEQLAATQEVFSRQLQFQHELFDQLRSLRNDHSHLLRAEHSTSDDDPEDEALELVEEEPAEPVTRTTRRPRGRGSEAPVQAADDTQPAQQAESAETAEPADAPRKKGEPKPKRRAAEGRDVSV